MNEKNICKLLSDKEVNNFIDELLKLPVEKNNNCLSTYGSVNVDDLITAVKEIRKVPTYDVVLQENMKLKQKLQQKEDIINKAIEELYIWGETLNPEFQKRMLEILEKSDK